MSPERLKKVEEMFHAVLEVQPSERRSYLQRSCGGDSELLREVESLLSYEADFASVIDSAPKSLVVEVFGNRAADVVGQQINQYRIEKKIGEGGMGTVYLAADSKLERNVALKLLSDEFARDATRRNRFFQEAKSASALNHPNILTVHEIGEHNGTHYIVTEFIRGRTLKTFLTDDTPSLQAILDIAIQIASALLAAHEAGIIHRDIKPDNIMVRNDGIVKVLDFGIAKLIDPGRVEVVENEAETRVRPATLPGMIIGTPQYMSPEQARGQTVDPRSDIFSFGVLLYEMIAGRPPFTGITKMDLIGSILKDEPKPLSDYQPEIAERLDEIVGTALRKDREQRYQHIRDLLTDLNDFKKTIERDTELVINRTGMVDAATTVNTTSSLVLQRRFSLIHVFLLLTVVGAVGAGVWWRLPRSKPAFDQIRVNDLFSWAARPGEFYSSGSFSPDGRMIAFSSTKSGTRNIWIKQTSAGEAVQVTRDEFRNEDPIWSPNGEEIAYFSAKGDQAGFWRVPVLGGAPKLIAAVDDGSSRLRFWSTRNQLYFESQSDLYQVGIDGGKIIPVTSFRAQGIEASSISISPDETRVAYLTNEGDDWIIWTKGLNDASPQRLLTSRGVELRNTVWHPNNRQILYSASVDGIFQAFTLDVTGGDPQQISASERDCYVVAAAADGTRVLYGSAKEESDIWSYDLKAERELTVATDIDSELWPHAAPDGKTIAYQSVRNLSQGNRVLRGRILTQTLHGEGPPVEVADDGGLPVWSPDGKSLAYLRLTGTKIGLEVYGVGSGAKRLVAHDLSYLSYMLLPYNRTQTNHFDWSPDSRQLASVSYRDGVYNIDIVGRDGTGETQLTDNRDKQLYLSCPLWTLDGKSIVYTSKTGNSATDGSPSYQIWLVEVATKKVTPVTPPGGYLRLIGWGARDQELLIARTDGSEMVGLHEAVTIHDLDLKTAAERQTATLKDTYLFNIQLSPDRKSIAYVAHRQDTDNLWIIGSGGGTERKLTANNDSRLFFSSVAWSPDSGSIYFGKQSRYSLLSMLTNFK